MGAPEISLAGHRVGAGRPLFVIAGPDVIESEELVLRHAARLKDVCARLGVPFAFKCSYDKANRTSIKSYRGPGLTEGLRVLRKVKETVGVPILTDVHETAEIAAAAAVVDVLQIPAFLCRQTALLQAAARTGLAVNVKKGQFLAPADMRNAADKVTAAGGDRVILTERGTTFGYGDLVVDMRALVVMRESGWPVVYDATHSLQRPGGAETGGDRRFAFPLMRAAVACGVDGLFFECHPEPARALSDAATQLPLEDAERFLDEALRVRAATEAGARA